MRVGGYTEKVLERAHPGCEVNCQGVPHRRFVLRRGQPDSGESYKADGLVAPLPMVSAAGSVASLAVRKFRERMLRTRLRTGVWEPLMPDVVASKA